MNEIDFTIKNCPLCNTILNHDLVTIQKRCKNLKCSYENSYINGDQSFYMSSFNGIDIYLYQMYFANKIFVISKKHQNKTYIRFKNGKSKIYHAAK